MALWQQDSQKADCCSARGPSLCNIYLIDTISSEYNSDNTVIPAKWGILFYLNAIIGEQYKA